MDQPRILINDPKIVNRPHKQALAAWLEDILEAEDSVELAKKAAKKPVKRKTAPVDPQSQKIINTAKNKFKEHEHPRDASGKFAKKEKTSGKVWQPLNIPKKPKERIVKEGSGAPGSIHSKITVKGDQGFHDILAGLALGAINEVHDVPPSMKKVTLEQGSLWAYGARGIYVPDKDGIAVDTDGKGRALTAIHEIGHYLDYKMGANKLTEDKGLWAAITRSSIYQTIKRIGEETTDKETKEQVGYLLTPTEVFARAYTQYIVTRSSNETLKKEFKERQDEEGTHWDAIDFADIGREFDRIFKTKKKGKK